MQSRMAEEPRRLPRLQAPKCYRRAGEMLELKFVRHPDDPRSPMPAPAVRTERIQRAAWRDELLRRQRRALSLSKKTASCHAGPRYTGKAAHSDKAERQTW